MYTPCQFGSTLLTSSQDILHTRKLYAKASNLFHSTVALRLDKGHQNLSKSLSWTNVYTPCQFGSNLLTSSQYILHTRKCYVKASNLFHSTVTLRLDKGHQKLTKSLSWPKVYTPCQFGSNLLTSSQYISHTRKWNVKASNLFHSTVTLRLEKGHKNLNKSLSWPNMYKQCQFGSNLLTSSQYILHTRKCYVKASNLFHSTVTLRLKQGHKNLNQSLSWPNKYTPCQFGSNLPLVHNISCTKESAMSKPQTHFTPL